MKKSIIAETLINNHSIKKHSKAVITGEKVGADTFEKWQFAIKCAYEAFTKYEIDCTNLAMKEEKADATNAFKELQSILDLIGEVNGHAIPKKMDLLKRLSQYSIKITEQLIGEAAFVKSQLDNYKDELENVHTGMREEYIANLERNIAETQARLDALTSTTGSAKKETVRVKFGTFKYNLERELGAVVSEQQMKTWEELEAEEQARKDERKAKANERRKARRAKAKAEAEATANTEAENTEANA